MLQLMYLALFFLQKSMSKIDDHTINFHWTLIGQSPETRQLQEYRNKGGTQVYNVYTCVTRGFSKYNLMRISHFGKKHP